MHAPQTDALVAWLQRDQPFLAALTRRRQQRRGGMVRPITITAVLNGWVVQCGCQTLAYQDRRSLLLDLDDYLQDPSGVEQRFLKEAVNAAHVGDGFREPNAREAAPRDEASRMVAEDGRETLARL